MQRRINRIYGQWKGAEDDKAVLQGQLADLEGRYSALEARLNQVPRPPAQVAPALPPQAQAGYPGFQPPAYTPPQPPAQPASGTPDPVVGAIQALNDRLDRRDQMEVLATQQESSWSEAVAEFPELRDPNSPLTQAAKTVFQRDQNLRLAASGPYRAVIMARGLLADSVRQEANLEDRRRAAGTPTGTALGGEGTSRAQVQQEYDAVMADMQANRGNQHENWKKARYLQRQLMGGGR
jgi:hypothetical protein